MQRIRFSAATTVAARCAWSPHEGKIEWQWDCKSPQDCWKLPNGNYLFCFVSGALEVTPDKKVVWEYKQASSRP
jgi:hypothetical protein